MVRTIAVLAGGLWLLAVLAAAPRPLDAPTPVSLQGCNGMHDTKPGCAGDPAPWVCNRTGKGKKGTHACSCQQRCRPDEDGNLEQYDESEDCPRRCNTHCECHVEEECKQGAIGH